MSARVVTRAWRVLYCMHIPPSVCVLPSACMLFLGFVLYASPLGHCTDRGNLNRLLEAIKPKLYEEPPEARWRTVVFNFVKAPWFDQVIMGIIVMNTLSMAMEHHGQSHA